MHDRPGSQRWLYQIGAGYAALLPLACLKQRPLRESDGAVAIGRPLSVVVDAPRADEETLLFHVRRAFTELPLGRRVLTRRHATSAPAELVVGDGAGGVTTAPDLGGALFKACGALADDEIVYVFSDASAEARRLLRALGGVPIEALDEKPVSQRRPPMGPLGPDFAFAG